MEIMNNCSRPLALEMCSNYMFILTYALICCRIIPTDICKSFQSKRGGVLIIGKM